MDKLFSMAARVFAVIALFLWIYAVGLVVYWAIFDINSYSVLLSKAGILGISGLVIMIIVAFLTVNIKNKE